MINLQSEYMAAEEQSVSTELATLLVLIFLAFYLILTAFLENRRFPVHRTAVAIIVGIIAGFILYITSQAAYKKIAKLDEVIIFNVLFPPMIFAQGYTLHKSVFFKNVKYILVFGLLGTFVSFFMSWGMIYQANQWDLVRDSADIQNIRTLSDWEILLVAACLCSIDTIAAEQTVCQYKYPRLYSVVFGQDLIKDTVTIVLFDSIMSLQNPDSPDALVVKWYTFFQMLLNFLWMVIGSVAAGLIGAFASTYLSKKMRFLSLDKGVSETGFLFLIGFFTYIATEMLNLSGSISLLLYGIFLNHYNIYNMSEQSRHASVSTFTLLSNICEGGLFLIMGILVWQGQWQSPSSDDDKMTHSYLFFGVVLLIVCICRFVNIYVLGWLSKKLTKDKFSFCYEQMHILFFGGLVRGAVPFVLFSSVSFSSSNHYLKNQGLVLKTTIIFVIIFTSLFFNSLIPYIYRRRLKYLKAEYQRIFGDSQIEHKQSGKKHGRIKQFEEKYIKNLLIFDYEERKDSIKQQKNKKYEAIMAKIVAEEAEDEILTQQDRGQKLLQ